MRFATHSGSTRRIRFAALAVASVLALGLLNAQQAAAAPLPMDYQAGPVTGPARTFEYGGEPAARRILIGSNTGTLNLRPGFAAIGEVRCVFIDWDGNEFPSKVWTPEQWVPPPGVNPLAIPAGVVPVGSTQESTVRCETGAAFAVQRVIWTLQGATGVPNAILLADDPTKKISQTDTYFYRDAEAERRTIPLGARVRVIGAPGTWGPVPQNAEADGGVFLEIPSTPPLFTSGEDVAVTGDGSTIGFTIPAVLPPTAVPGAESRISIRTTARTPGTPTTPAYNRVARWSTGAVFTEPAKVSRTALKLSSSWGLSIRAVKATATVAVPATASPLGTVTFSVDGKAVGQRTLTNESRGKITYTLPRLKPDTYRVTATYSGTTSIEPSISPPVILKILF